MTLTRPELKAGMTKEDDTAHLMVDGLVMNAVTAMDYSKSLGGHSDLSACFARVQQAVEAVKAGDLSSVEGILAGQIVSLNAIFTDLALAARANSKDAERFDNLLKLAFRAQSQCRATAESLAFVQNPTGAIFAKQANIAHGPQQINNGIAPSRSSRTEESESQPNRLLEADGERMDDTTSAATGPGDSAVEAVGAVHRPTQRRR